MLRVKKDELQVNKNLIETVMRTGKQKPESELDRNLWLLYLNIIEKCDKKEHIL